MHDFIIGHLSTGPDSSNSGSIEDIADVILSEGPENGEPEIAVGRDIVLRILRHLECWKKCNSCRCTRSWKNHVVKKNFGDLWKHHRTGNEYLPISSNSRLVKVSRHRCSINLQQDKWHSGCGIKSCRRQERWLLIDEFNRADINKAFGEMFLAHRGWITFHLTE